MSTTGDVSAEKIGTTGATSAPNAADHAPAAVSVAAIAAIGSASWPAITRAIVVRRVPT